MRLWANVSCVAALRALSCGVLLALGFRAISDDDYARVVIAQRFAENASWDPSGTSWLPLPFWISGAFLRVFGPELEVARVAGLVCGVLAALLVLLSGRWAGLSDRAALAGALIACALPWFVWLGASTTPEALAGALMLLGVCSSSSPKLTSRLLGAVALGLACWARYEAWPLAVVFAAFCALDALRQRSPRLAVCALLALVPACIWLAHGALHHGDALFFVQRVVAYRRALGTGQGPGFLAVLVAYPSRLGAARELLLLAALAAAAAYRLRALPAEWMRSLQRPLVLLCSLLAFLIWGELRDGAATHHPERALLPIWLWLALVCGDLGERIACALRDRPRILACSAAVALLALSASLLRAYAFSGEHFADRRAEVAIGRAAAELGSHASASTRPGLLIDSAGFAYFAVIAGYGRPEHAAPLDDHDPRRARQPDLLKSKVALRARLRERRAAWLVVRRERAELARELGRERARNAAYVLFEVTPSGS